MQRKTALLVLVLLCASTSPFPTMAQEPFRPIMDENHWAYAAVTDLMLKGILEGYPDGSFRGKRAITRDEFAVAMDRLVKNLPKLLAVERADRERKELLLKLAPDINQLLPEDHFAYAAMRELQRAGLLKVYGSLSFAPRTQWWRSTFASLTRDIRLRLSKPDNQRLLTLRIQELLTKLEQEFRAEINALEETQKKYGL